ncbi:hypothetical protein Tco_1317954 [Tanacetum coccineum]
MVLQHEHFRHCAGSCKKGVAFCGIGDYVVEQESEYPVVDRQNDYDNMLEAPLHYQRLLKEAEIYPYIPASTGSRSSLFTATDPQLPEVWEKTLQMIGLPSDAVEKLLEGEDISKFRDLAKDDRSQTVDATAGTLRQPSQGANVTLLEQRRVGLTGTTDETHKA